MTLSVVIITYNEENNIGRTLESVKPLVGDGKGEIIVVDSGSTDRTVEIAKSFGAKVFVEAWKGYAAQKNSAIEKATGDWILSLDADEELELALADEIALLLHPGGSDHVRQMNHLRKIGYAFRRQTHREARQIAKREGMSDSFVVMISGYWIPRRNFFLQRWIRHGGFWPDPKLRLFRRGSGEFRKSSVHETVQVKSATGCLKHTIIHHSYPTLSDYIDHMNRYSSLAAEMIVAKGKVRFSVINIIVRPLATFVYNYFFRLGFLDGREGLLLHLYHAVYVSWKYARAWEAGSKASSGDPA